MLPVLLASAAWIVALLGLGHLLARAMAPGADPGTTGLLGLFVLAALGTTVHLAFPVSPPLAAVTLLFGIIAFGANARRILAGMTLADLGAVLVALVVFATLNQFPARHYDMGLYWLQSVKWTSESAQVPGIATLHYRFGFNSSWFTVAAMLEHPLAVAKSAFLTTTIVLVFAAWSSLVGFREIACGRGSFNAVLAASMALLAVCCAGLLGGHSPDAAGAVVGFAAFVGWARALERREEFRIHAPAAVLLSSFAFTIKMSYAVLPVAALALLLLRRRWVDRALALRLVLPPLALVLPWIGHGYLASGCPFFPSSVGCVSFEWTTPASIRGGALAWIQSWARAPGKMPATVLGSWGWLPEWARSMMSSKPIQVLVALLAASTVLLFPRANRLRRTMALLWGVALAGVAFWFAMAPSPRFAWGFLFALALVPAAEISDALLARWPGRTSAGLLFAAFLVATGWIATESLDWVRREPTGAFRFATWPRIPARKIHVRQTLTGVTLVIPVGTAQCWLAPLPCTPHFDPGLMWDGSWRTTTTRRGEDVHLWDRDRG